MNILYYPGCTVKRNAREYEDSTLAVLNKLGYNVVELRKWYCCGALYSLAVDDLIKHLGAVRTLINAEKMSREYGSKKLLTICPMCYNVLKRVHLFLEKNPDKLETISQYMDEEERYKLSIETIHVVQLLYEKRDELKKLIVRNLGEASVSVYYGCTIVRPKDIGIDNPDDPRIVEELLRGIGVRVVETPYKTYCCGSYHVLDNPDLVYKNSLKIINSVVEAGASIIVTVCPLCLYNLEMTLEKTRFRREVRVVYLTELLAYLMGLDQHVSKQKLGFLNKFFNPKPV